MTIKSKKIQDENLEAMIAIADEIVNQARYDKTEFGTLISIDGATNTAIVLINNQNNTVKIKAGITINIGDVVIVKSPQNNKSLKYIDGKLL